MTALLAIAALALLVSIPWFVLAGLAEIAPSLRPRARWHVKASMKTAGIAFVSVIVLTIAAPKTTTEGVGNEPEQAVASEEDRTEPEAIETSDLGVSTGEIARPTSRPTLASDSAPEPEPAPPARSRPRDAIDNASLLCRMLDSSGETSAPCEYSAWHSTITLSASMLPGQARDLCSQIADLSGQMAMGLAGWTLHIRSPYSGENSIAFCRLA